MSETPEKQEIVSSFDGIRKLMDLYDKGQITDEGKFLLAIQTAFLALMIRKKYKLTSAYYTIAEARAIEKYKEIYET